MMTLKTRWGEEITIPESKKVTGQICHMGDLTLTNADLDSDIHEGFTVGKNGRIMYWMMIWHSSSGGVTVFPKDKPFYRRWLPGDTEITVHFK